MSPIAVSLVVLSAFMHAGWNLLSKRREPSAAFFLIASISGACLLAPTLVLYGDALLHAISARVWLLLVATGFAMALYYASLAGAYRSGDMSVAYPLARSLPAVIVLLVAVVLGRADQVSIPCVSGIVLVVGGCLLLPVRRFGDLHVRNYLAPVCGLALLAALGTTGYSVADDEALRELRAQAGPSLGITQVTLLYACLEAVSVSCWLALLVGLRRRGRRSFRRVLNADLRPAVYAGVAIHLTYGLVLVSLAFADNVSYVVGLRQLSIPLGAAVGILVLKEPPHAPKLAGVAIMFAGLLLVALG